MEYDYYKETAKRSIKGRVVIIALIAIIILAAAVAANIYMELIQLDEIGGLSHVFTTNLAYQAVFFAASFILIFVLISITNSITIKNINHYLKQKNLNARKMPNFSIAALIALAGSFLMRNFFYLKALSFFNSTAFGKTDPLFSKDIGYYVFQRPFLMSIYEFAFTLWLFVIVYTIAYYFLMLLPLFNNGITANDLKIKTVIRHNLINLAVLFIIKAFSYGFLMEGILYSNVVNTTGAGYVDVNIWMNYFRAAPIILVIIVAAAIYCIWNGKLRRAAYAIAAFPAIWVLVAIIAGVVQGVVVKPNEIGLERNYLKFNMEKTREAYGLDKVKNFEFPNMEALTPDIINKNIETKNNIRVVDYQATLDSNRQLQSNTNFYSFNDGDIINYNINGKENPVLITAREIDKSKLPDRSYLNTTYRYTHGYGIVINPINRLTPEGQVDYIMSGLVLNSTDPKLKVTEPRIYYGELTRDHVIVNAGNNLQEIDYDGTGNTGTSYNGPGGIKLSVLNRLLFALRYGDMNMIISGYVSPDSKLLLNREILGRAQMAVPFLTLDRDPYIILGDDGRLKWIIDAYTTTQYYPYSQGIDYYNYIRNSVKIVIDAYDGKMKYYVIDKNDPIINTYKKIYKGVFSDEPLPSDVVKHSRYPETLFKVQTEVLRRYHLDPDGNAQNVDMFYSNQDYWDIAKYSGSSQSGETGGALSDIEPYYNMIRLPGNIGQNEELILMRPFTPSNKHNMISWLAVRNSFENYGELILFNFPKNTNIFGPNQVEVKINQIDKVSKDMTLWGQSGSRVFKGNLLVIPIQNSVLYVEPIYIQAAGASSIPEVREIVVGYQKGDEFKYGIGTNLDDALGQLFSGIAPAPGTAAAPPAEEPAGKTDNQRTIDEIKAKYNAIKKQMDELDELMKQLQ